MVLSRQVKRKVEEGRRRETVITRKEKTKQKDGVGMTLEESVVVVVIAPPSLQQQPPPHVRTVTHQPPILSVVSPSVLLRPFRIPVGVMKRQ